MDISQLSSVKDTRGPYIIVEGIFEQTDLPALYIVFIILILIINIFLIAVILLSKSMRSSSRHLLIINVCVVDIIMGLVVLPVLLNQGLQDEDTASCSTKQSLRIFADFILPSVATLAILALNADYILRLYCNMYGEGISRIVLLVLLFVVPWLSSCLILIPLYKENLPEPSNLPQPLPTLFPRRPECYLRADDQTERTLLLLSFFPQAFLVLVFNAAVSVVYLFNRESYGLDVQGERIRAPVDICLASFATLVLYAPVFLIAIVTTRNMGCDKAGECRALDDVYDFAIWSLLTKSWLMCFSWFTCRDTRAAIREVLRF